jgi:hypothetical protein
LLGGSGDSIPFGSQKAIAPFFSRKAKGRAGSASAAAMANPPPASSARFPRSGQPGGVQIGQTGNDSRMHETEMIAQELIALEHKLGTIENRLTAVETANRQLEEAALTTARALAEISGHWDAVYEAMRRKDESQRSD